MYVSIKYYSVCMMMLFVYSSCAISQRNMERVVQINIDNTGSVATYELDVIHGKLSSNTDSLGYSSVAKARLCIDDNASMGVVNDVTYALISAGVDSVAYGCLNTKFTAFTVE